MLNRYPLWKYIGLLMIIIIALVYALPNLYGEDPAIQISGGRGVITDGKTQDLVIEVLKKNDIQAKSISLSNSTVLVRFNNTDIQLKSQELLANALGDKYIVALNLAPATPTWLRMIGAEPMKLGLDLRGGVHFLMEIDMATAFNKLQEQLQDTLLSELQSKKIPYSGIAKNNDNGVDIRFNDAESRSNAMNYLQARNREFYFSNGANNTLHVIMTEDRLREVRESAVTQNITILRKRVNQLGVAEPIIQRQGADRIVVQLPGIQDTARAKEILGATATLEFRQVDTSVNKESALRGYIPGSSEVKYDVNGNPVVLYKRVILTGDHITDSSSQIDRESGRPVVTVTLDSIGGQIMSDFTQRNLTKPIATLFIEYKDSGKRDKDNRIILERREEVISVATIDSRFSSRFQISGVGSMADVRNLSVLLRAGALIAPIQIVEERTVGPSLGQQNIVQGIDACFWGLVITVAFMLAVYKLFGFFASFAVIVNVILIVGIMSLLPGATLTMPGIAGIVLTVGMAVDANVLINERIKEELRNGRGIQHAIHEGYNGAFTSIFDANITTLITAVILYGFGTGSIKGFAITLGIGVLTSMFTSIVGTRALANLIYGGRRVNKLSI